MVRFPDLAFDEALAEFAEDVVAGLSSRPRTLPCKYFYDARGSELFEAITGLPEYYPTRAEIGILRDRARDICAQLAPGSALIEYGSGSSIKTEILLAACDFAAYAPIDISPSALAGAARRLRRRFPGLRVEPVIGDFVGDVELPASLDGLPRAGFFPGSTIGNFSPPEARALLRRMARQLGPGAKLVIGVDLRKSEDILVPAYDDAQGVTAAFNLNLLARLGNELGARLDLDGFAHRAIWNARESRIEMHLVATRPQTIVVAGRAFSFAAGETIHTENSHKYGLDDFDDLARGAGWRPLETFVDDDSLFSVRLLEAA
ncbi:MAG TPA: L-histidine N(alpha)-methyltransferase [Rhodoblastus sp.]|nr:L-histidine N(alpha)-methyltransferase [Rhodoblastus sp.]